MALVYVSVTMVDVDVAAIVLFMSEYGDDVRER
jgi:hypothetical protein